MTGRPPVDPLREAAHRAVEAWTGDDDWSMEAEGEAMGALRAALASPAVPGPFAWCEACGYAHPVNDRDCVDASPAVPRPAATLHTCWDNHDGPNGTHADGSPCRDKATPLYAAVPPEGLDVEPLRDAAIIVRDYLETLLTGESLSMASVLRYGLARLSDTGDTLRSPERDAEVLEQLDELGIGFRDRGAA